MYLVPSVLSSSHEIYEFLSDIPHKKNTKIVSFAHFLISFAC